MSEQPIELEAELPPFNRSGNRRGLHLRTHGMGHTHTYNLWCKMKERCNNPKAINYERYGGRGVKVCEEWANSFPAFLNDMGECPSLEHSIERINNCGNYCPGNCKWATRLEQANNKRNNVMVNFRGELRSVADWCRILNLNYPLTRQRIYRDKWSPERAFQT